MRHCKTCSRPLPPGGPSQNRCADHLNTPTIAERQAMHQQNAARAALFREIMARHGVGSDNAMTKGAAE